MALTPEQILCAQEWNNLIETKAKTALGAELAGEKFTAANYTAGFNYHVKSSTYNSRSIKALDSLVCFENGVNHLDLSYSDYYKSVMQKIHFNISKSDLQRVNKEAIAQEALVATIINSYKQSEIDDTPMEDPTVPKIIKRVKEYTGVSYRELNPKEYPFLANLCNYLNEFERKAEFTTKIMNASSKAEDRLEAIIKHITKPDDDNGGLKTEEGFVCGWDGIKEPVQLLESLEGGRTITIDISASHFHSNKSRLNFKNDVKIDVPVNWFFNLGVQHNDEYDLSKSAKDGAEMSISITYDGVTLVSANPKLLSANNSKGWYVKEILTDAAAKTGKDVTGYQLVDSEFDPETLFGEEGKLRRMKTLVISQHPIVKLHFKKFDSDKLKKQFDETTNADFELFGGIISGNHKNGYNMSECKIDKSSDSLEVTFTPQPLGSSGTAVNQTAYVLGGVIDYVKIESEVNKVRILEDNVDAAENDVALPEGLEDLKLMYRKNDDGEYELAGLYDEKEDIEDMLGDTVAVPITSQLANPHTQRLRRGTTIYNVIGSANDTFEGHARPNWIRLWRQYTGQATKCYVCPNNQCGGGRRIVGAHVVLQAGRARPNANDILYIVPICINMNNAGGGAQMTLTEDVTALRLNRFLH